MVLLTRSTEHIREGERGALNFVNHVVMYAILKEVFLNAYNEVRLILPSFYIVSSLHPQLRSGPCGETHLYLI